MLRAARVCLLTALSRSRQSSIEFFAQKEDASLFAFSNHNKKRPNNMVLGRLFGHESEPEQPGSSAYALRLWIGNLPLLLAATPRLRSPAQQAPVDRIAWCHAVLDMVELGVTNVATMEQFPVSRSTAQRRASRALADGPIDTKAKKRATTIPASHSDPRTATEAAKW